MKKIIVLFAVLTIGFGSFAATSFTGEGYFRWTIDPVDESLKFAYAMLAGVDFYGEVTHLTVSDPVTGDVGDGVYNEATFPETTDLGASYFSLVDVDPGKPKGYYIELYDINGNIIGVSDVVSESDIVDGGYIAKDMATTGILSAYHFRAHVPEPTGGMLLMLGFGLLSLRRRLDDVVTVS